MPRSNGRSGRRGCGTTGGAGGGGGSGRGTPSPAVDPSRSDRSGGRPARFAGARHGRGILGGAEPARLGAALLGGRIRGGRGVPGGRGALRAALDPAGAVSHGLSGRRARSIRQRRSAARGDDFAGILDGPEKRRSPRRNGAGGWRPRGSSDPFGGPCLPGVGTNPIRLPAIFGGQRNSLWNRSTTWIASASAAYWTD